MNKNRLEAFSDGVLAIILTIMVLEIKVPEGYDFATLQKVFPVLLSYILSFVYIGIYWNNHHHMLQSVTKVNGKILWANLHLLFWLSLVPVSTGWIGETHFAKFPMALYGLMLLMAGVAYYILQITIVKSQGPNSVLKKAIKKDFKGKFSLFLYTIGIAFSFYNEWISGGIYILVALMWLVPDSRIEDVIDNSEAKS